MGLRTALTQARIVTLGVVLAGAWLIFNIQRVYNHLGPLSDATPGRTPVAGLVGLLVMLVLGFLLVYLLSELSEESPAPDPWPPEGR
ncbi:MAG: hypothetical protein ABEH47_03525 [Haloferacaceae archaeon]